MSLKPNRNRARDLGFYVLLIVILISTIYLMTSSARTEKLVYSDLVNLFTEEKVQSFVTENGKIYLDLRTG